MTSKSAMTAEQFKKTLKDSGLEDAFLKGFGLDSLDELAPMNFRDIDAESVQPKLTTKVTVDSTPVPAPPLPKAAADARPSSTPTVASDILSPYITTNISYANRKTSSTYVPTSMFMFYMVHLINSVLTDNFYFKRHCPDYHPYILRLYYGIIFWIQILRARMSVNTLNNDEYQFLVQFVSSHRLESLPIVGPLVPLFKTLCASQPELLSYGPVVPTTPATPGPNARSAFMRPNQLVSYVLPNVPGIFALLEDLNGLINGATPTYPKKGKHIPVEAAAKTFGHHAFPAQDTRTDADKWSLVTPGLEYPCEADQKLNEAFAERYENFSFPATAANDNLSTLPAYFSMNRRSDWFTLVKDVASSAATFFEGSGTLADCSPSGIVSNQLIVSYHPDTPIEDPTRSADPKSLFSFAIRLSTTARSLPPLAEAMAAQAQTHCRMPTFHPYLSTIGTDATRTGPFWDIRPIEKSYFDEDSYLAMHSIIKKMMKAKI